MELKMESGKFDYLMKRLGVGFVRPVHSWETRWGRAWVYKDRLGTFVVFALDVSSVPITQAVQEAIRECYAIGKPIDLDGELRVEDGKAYLTLIVEVAEVPFRGVKR